MDLGLKGKVAIVAGASRGLGRAVAQELAAEGTSLVICARNAEVLSEVQEQIATTTAAQILAVTADVSRTEDIAAVTTAALQEFGRIDILVTNAGGPPAGPFESLNAEQWEAATRLTLFSALDFSRRVL